MLNRLFQYMWWSINGTWIFWGGDKSGNHNESAKGKEIELSQYIR